MPYQFEYNIDDGFGNKQDRHERGLISAYTLYSIHINANVRMTYTALDCLPVHHCVNRSIDAIIATKNSFNI